MTPGRRIMEGLQEAIDSNLAAVTIDGQRWVKLPPGHWIAPMEATEEMEEAGGLSAYIDDWAGAVWQAMRDAHLKAQG